MTLTYNTTFGTQLGETQERINATFEYDHDFTGDTYNDIKVTLELESADNSGTEDMIGIAFDINNDAVSNLAIQNIQRFTENGALSTFPPISYITTNGVPSNGQNAIPDFPVDVPTDSINFDVGIQFSDGGSGDGIVQSASFILSKPDTSIEKSLIENTDWYIRLQSTNGGAGSAKMGGVIGEISDANPVIDVEKYVSVDGGINWEDADTVTGPSLLTGNNPQFKFVVENDGNVDLSNITLSDSDFGLDGLTGDTTTGNNQYNIATLAAGASTEVLLTEAPWQAGQHTNTATANGSYNTTTVSDTDDANYFGAEPKIDVEKYVSVDAGKTWEDADTVTGPSLLTGNNPQFKFVVKNDGNVDLSNITLSDSDFGLDGLTGDATTGNNQYNIATLAAGASTEVLLTGTPWQADQHTNTATANGNYNTTTVSDTDDANYFGANPDIAIEKVTTATTASGLQTGDNLQNVLLGSSVTWTYTVTNTGNVALSSVNVDDNKLDSANDPVFNTVISGNGDDIFDKDEVWEYTATGTAIAGDYTNIGTVTGDFTDGSGNTTSVSDTNDSGYSTEKGLGKTPGFWKQSQHFQYWPEPYKTTDKFSTTFGVSTTSDTTFKYGGYDWFNDSLLGALSAEDLKGSTGSNAVKTYGNVSALGRSATAALLNATSDELNNNVKGDDIKYIIDPTLLLPEVVTFLSTKVDGIFDANGVQTVLGNGIISSVEVLNAVKDVFTSGGGLYGASDVNSLAKAFDAMNNMAGG